MEDLYFELKYSRKIKKINTYREKKICVLMLNKYNNVIRPYDMLGPHRQLLMSLIKVNRPIYIPYSSNKGPPNTSPPPLHP